MSLLRLSVKHGRTLEEARLRLERVVDDVQNQFGSLVDRIEWSDDRHSVSIRGRGVEVEIRVDAEEVHVVGDLPLLGRLFATPLTAGLKGIVEQAFQKRLT